MTYNPLRNFESALSPYINNPGYKISTNADFHGPSAAPSGSGMSQYLTDIGSFYSNGLGNVETSLSSDVAKAQGAINSAGASLTSGITPPLSGIGNTINNIGSTVNTDFLLLMLVAGIVGVAWLIHEIK